MAVPPRTWTVPRGVRQGCRPQLSRTTRSVAQRLVPRGRAGSGDALVEHLGGECPERAHRLADGGEGGAGVARGHDVVPAGDRDVAARPAGRCSAATMRAERDLVVGADEGVGAVADREQGRRRRAVPDASSNRHGVDGAARCRARRAPRARPCQRSATSGDSSGEPEERDRGGRRARRGARRARGRWSRLSARTESTPSTAGGPPGRPAARPASRDGLVGRRCGRAGRARRTRPARSRTAASGSGRPWVARTSTLRPSRRRGLLVAQQHLGVVRAGQVREDDAVGGVPALGQRGAGVAGAEAELGDGREHPVAGRLGHRGGAAQGPGDGRDADAGALGDVVDRHRAQRSAGRRRSP